MAFPFFAAAFAPAATPADTLRVVKATVFDFPIGAFGGEFGARKPGACGYSKEVLGPSGKPFDIVPGMVADTLPYSRERKKKAPARGLQDCNSAGLENWFHPDSAAVACREIAMAPLDTAGRRLWRFHRKWFFPVDDLPGAQLEGPGPGWDSIPDLTVAADWNGPHNYNWCLEINAQFAYRGGETFHFRGDDDVWVYLDNRLAVDLGGIHGADFRRSVVLDSFPGIAGRIGETFDLDLYFCERRPSGSEFEMETDLELMPARFRDLAITRPDGNFPDPRVPLSGKTRFCAKADFAPADPCGNVLPVPPSPFYPALWTLDGALVARDSACIDIDPAALPLNRRISLLAKAEGKTARLNLQVVQANAPSRVALTGVGRWEGLSLHFRDPADSLQAPLRVEFPFAGEPRSVAVPTAEYDAASGAARVVLPAASLGPAGISALDSDTGRIFQTLAGFDLDFTAPLLDSIAPAVAEAAWTPAPQGGFFLDFRPSETLSAPPAAGGLLFKRTGIPAPLAPMPALGIEPGPMGYRAYFPPGYAPNPRNLDSLSFTPFVRDAGGVEARIRFAPIRAPLWNYGSADIAEISLERNPVKAGPWIPQTPGAPLVLLDGQGQPLAPTPEAARLASIGGPVLRVRTPYALDRLDFEVFTNLGAFVYSGTYRFTLQEWERLKAQGGDTVTFRILWHPSSRGAKLGTGVYLLRAAVTTRASLNEEGGVWKERRPARRMFGPWRFGFIRG